MTSNSKNFVIEKLKQATKLVQEASCELSNLTGEEISEIISNGFLTDLLFSFLSPSNDEPKESLFEYLIQNRKHLQFAPIIYKELIRRCTFEINNAGFTTIISPSHMQWVENGFMYLEGFTPFSGGIRACFPDETIKIVTARRHICPGEKITHNDIKFLPIESANHVARTVPSNLITDLDAPIHQLKDLLAKQIENESEYQSLISKFPWILGAQYLSVHSHKILDDGNIPDFTALRVKDLASDIFEIKQPFLKCFRKNGSLSSEFLSAWQQLLRYIDFAEQESSYLNRQKSIKFNNPKGYLIIGYNLNQKERLEIQRLERQHKNIQILTYDDLLSYSENTVSWVRKLRESGKQDNNNIES